jgi:cell wall-associated NlpC family hydrolase
MNLTWDHLLHHPFLMGERDCFALARQFYIDNFDIHVPNYARPTNWVAGDLDLVRALYERNGFEMITDWKPGDLRPGDVMMMAVGDTAANHISIYVGDNKMIHHLFGRTSNEEPFRAFWQNLVCYLLRHPSVPDLRPVLPDTDIGSLLRARYQLVSDA